ncbi:pentapeptide repeat-containing protein, partial [Campylobacter coli]
ARVSFRISQFKNEVRLSINNFLYAKNINFIDIVFGKLVLQKELFEKSVNFERCIFLQDVNFKDYTFNEIAFNTCTFKESAYFNNSNFTKGVDFHECEFEKTACFYGVKFDETPNFSQALFKGNINIINSNLNFDFTKLDKKIRLLSLQGEGKYDYEIANDFRDSFRNFKSALIKDNNLLDASNFHKYELYCKEIELKQNWNQRDKNVENMRDVEKSTWRIRDLVDFLLLGFYRKLCDHHTDFLKVFNNLVLLIVLYTLFFRGFIWLHDDELKDTRKILTLFEFFDSFKFGFNIGVGICMVLGFILVLCKIDKISIKSFLNILKIFKYLSCIKKWLPKIFKKEIFVKLFLKLKIILLDLGFLIESLIIIPLIPCVFYGLFSLFGFFLNLDKDFGYSLFINILFISLYICLVYTKSLFFGRYVVLVLSYIGFFIILIKQPSIIHPLIGKIANEADKSFNYPSLIVLNILYTILLALVLFSLQKTARKNSIVPS